MGHRSFRVHFHDHILSHQILSDLFVHGNHRDILAGCYSVDLQRGIRNNILWDTSRHRNYSTH